MIHPPEQCFSRREYKEEFNQWAKHMKESSDRLGIKIEGAYLTPNEHTFYFVLDCNDLKSISTFLGPPMLTHHVARVVPVIDIEEAAGLPFMREK